MSSESAIAIVPNVRMPLTLLWMVV
jgi:hypothetical protein